MEEAKAANAIIRDGLSLLTEEADIKHFAPIKTIFTTASGMIQGEQSKYKEAMLKGWMVSQANNMVFLLWRRGILTPEIEKAYRELPSTEEAVKDYDDFEDAFKAAAEELEDRRSALAEKQHDVDIFKAVLNGRSKKEAEAEYERYKAQVTRAMRG